MIRFSRIFLSLTLMALPLMGCGVATQNIPVSSNPSGAVVYADGTQTCTTPCTVKLEKTQAHILTLKKDGFQQADVQISQKYDTGGVTRDAVQSGMSSSSMGSSIEGSIAGALISAEQNEASGNAYVLTPSSVVVSLVPVGGSTSAATTAPSQQATIKTTEPATIGSAIEEDPAGVGEEVLKEAAVAAPTIGTEKEVSHHSHTSTHYNDDGSMSQHSSSSSVSVGVHVNPVEAGLGALEFLENAEKKHEAGENTDSAQ
nr:PEGA domain-containing protein [uncultured Pseudodesulfovibrio sp.]